APRSPTRRSPDLRGRQVEVRQVELRQVDVGAIGRLADEPVGDGSAATVLSGAPDDDGEADGALRVIHPTTLTAMATTAERQGRDLMAPWPYDPRGSGSTDPEEGIPHVHALVVPHVPPDGHRRGLHRPRA